MHAIVVLLPLAALLLVLTAAWSTARHRFGGLNAALSLLVVILAVVIAGWAVYDSYRIGDSGAKQFGPAASAPHPRTAGPTATERPST